MRGIRQNYRLYRRMTTFPEELLVSGRDSLVLDFIGATRRIRTGDLLITNQPLYQLS